MPPTRWLTAGVDGLHAAASEPGSVRCENLGKGWPRMPASSRHIANPVAALLSIRCGDSCSRLPGCDDYAWQLTEEARQRY